MAYDEKTTYLDLPLPHPRNTLREDCPRIRESLQALDQFARKSDAAVVSLAEADAALASAMQSQGNNLAAALSQEGKARSKADSDHDDAIAALKKQIEALQETVSKINPWDIFPLRVPIAVDGVTFGGSDGRRAIMPGETTARENWLICDGGSDGHGGTVPLLQGRVILGASDAYPAGSTGGSATHSHSISGTVGETTLSVEQMTNHTHPESRVAYNYGNHIQYGAGGMGWRDVQTGSTGGSQSHTHSLATSSGDAVSLPPYYALFYIMRIA